jgi:hypothetical protein
VTGIFVPWVSQGTMKKGIFHGSAMELCRQDALLVNEETYKKECSKDKRGNQAFRNVLWVSEGASMNVPLVSDGTKPAGMFCFLVREPYRQECSRD